MDKTSFFNRTFRMNTLLHKYILDKSIVNKCPVLISSSTCGPLSRLGVSYLCFWAQSWSIPRCTKAYNIIVYNRYEQNATWATTTRCMEVKILEEKRANSHKQNQSNRYLVMSIDMKILTTMFVRSSRVLFGFTKL